MLVRVANALKLAKPNSMGSALSTTTPVVSGLSQIKLLSWNIAAINNNPFEYWITYENPNYMKLMNDVQQFIQNPGDRDVPLSSIFTEDMFNTLESAFLQSAIENPGLNAALSPESIGLVREVWETDLKDRKIISEFLTDDVLGKKRLLSMPDRLTNTISVNGQETIYRPTPINCYAGTFTSTDDFYQQWIRFMFGFDPKNPKALENSGKTSSVVNRIQKIKKSKYPALTEKEESISIPLSTLCLALFDTVLVHMLDSISNDWQEIRHQLATSLNLNKNSQILNIISSTYSDTQLIFLQEVANSFKALVTTHPVLSHKYTVVTPNTSGKRDQNSVILLDNSLFDPNPQKLIDLTPQVTTALTKLTQAQGKTAPVAEGDILMVQVETNAGEVFVLGSFHGDTNGLATVPVLRAMMEVYSDVAKKNSKAVEVVIGMDANTYFESDNVKSQSLHKFFEVIEELGLESTYPSGSLGQKNDYTCYNGRTFLQTQLNKAIRSDQVATKGDVNQKDFVLYRKGSFTSSGFLKDNTGKKQFTNDMVFPTLQFPSDHAVIAATLHTTDQQKSEL